MKILLINYEYPPFGGGGGIFSKLLTDEWQKNNHEVKVLTVNFLRTKNTKTPLPNLLLFPFFGFFKGLILCFKNKFDVINTHFAVPTGPVGFILGKIFKIKNVLSIHGADIYDPTKKIHNNFLVKPVIKFVLNHADAVIAQSNNIKEQAIKYYLPKKNIRIIPLGIKKPNFPAVETQNFASLPKNKFQYIAIGRLIPRKGFDYLIKALPENSELIIIGDGPEKANLQKLAKQEKKSVDFLGNIPEEIKWQQLKQADCYVLSSLHEGFALVCLEAMAVGLPIIATNFGGQTDYLKENENAILVKPKNIESLRWAMQKIKSDENLRKKLSTNNLRDIEKYYINGVAEQYINLFEHVF